MYGTCMVKYTEESTDIFVIYLMYTRSLFPMTTSSSAQEEEVIVTLKDAIKMLKIGISSTISGIQSYLTGSSHP